MSAVKRLRLLQNTTHRMAAAQNLIVVPINTRTARIEFKRCHVIGVTYRVIRVCCSSPSEVERVNLSTLVAMVTLDFGMNTNVYGTTLITVMAAVSFQYAKCEFSSHISRAPSSYPSAKSVTNVKITTSEVSRPLSRAAQGGRTSGSVRLGRNKTRSPISLLEC